MYGDPLHTCKEVSANGDRIEVVGHHARLRIMVSQSRKTGQQQAGCLEKLRPRFDDGRVHVPRACSQPQGAQHIHTRTTEVGDVTGEIVPIAAHMDAARFAFGHGGRSEEHTSELQSPS